MNNILIESARGIQAVPVDDVLLNKREIYLTEEVTKDSSIRVIKELKALEYENPKEEISIYINSPGGDVMSGLAVIDYIKTMKTPVRTVVVGQAASMGAILFLSGHEREMYPHSKLMLHDPSYACGIRGMKPHELQVEVNKLNEAKEMLTSIIAEATGKSNKDVAKMTQKDTYFTSKEAIKYGLATGICGQEKPPFQ